MAGKVFHRIKPKINALAAGLGGFSDLANRKPPFLKIGNRGSCESDGGDEGDRTPDLSVANAALSQLSYTPIAGWLSKPSIWLV